MSIWRRIKRFFWMALTMDYDSIAAWQKAKEEGRDLIMPTSPEQRTLAWFIQLLLLGLTGVLFWMALGPVPGWIGQPVLAFWWVYVGLKFLFLGLPFLIVPFWLLWQAVRPGKKTAGEAPEPEAEPKIKMSALIPAGFITMRQVLLFLGLLAAGQYLLAALYVFPDIACFVLQLIGSLRAAAG